MTTEAERQCNKSNVNFGEAFAFQYVIAPESLSIPDFSEIVFEDVVLHIGPELFHTPLFDRNEEVFGYMLGVAADHEGNDPLEKFYEIIDRNDASSIEKFERYLTRLAGRYILIVSIAGELRAYFDPVAMIGAVYCDQTKRLASSPLLTIDRMIEPNVFYSHSKVAKGEGSFGMRDTADAHVKRINPNHVFDLKNFTHKRFWPFEDDVFEADESQYGAIYDEIIEAERNIIKSLAGRYISTMPLSGGNDSRLLFALAGDEGRAEIQEFYTHINNYGNRRDAVVAARICDIKNAPYKLHDRHLWQSDKYARTKAQRIWRIGSGVNSPPPLEVQNGVYQMVHKGSIVMRGHQTNIMRGQYYNFRMPHLSSDPEWVLKMMRLATHVEDVKYVPSYFYKQLESYREDLPACTKAVEADFIFLEALVPAALGVLFHGMNNGFYMSPFNSRRLVQLSMSFSVSHKLSNSATHDIILRAEPELADLPLGNSLPASFEETDEMVLVRQEFIEQMRDRYEGYFGEKAPEIRATKFEKTPYNQALSILNTEHKAEMRKKA